MTGNHAVLVFESTPTHRPDAEERWLRKFYSVQENQTLVKLKVVEWPRIICDCDLEGDTVLEYGCLSDTELE